MPNENTKLRQVRKRTEICAFCGVVYHPNPGGRKAKHRFCSVPCRGKFYSGPKNHNYIGEKQHRAGYVHILDPKGGRKREHVAIAEKALGRELHEDEVVHHINGDKTDNRNCNLLVCTRSYHHWLHNEMSRRFQLEKFGGRPCPNVSEITDISVQKSLEVNQREKSLSSQFVLPVAS